MTPGERLLSRFDSSFSTLRGRITPNAEMRKISRFGTGGFADVFFEPADEEDLAKFLRFIPEEIPLCVVGLGSNLLVRDGGIRGFVVRLSSKIFGQLRLCPDFCIEARAGCSGKSLSLFALEHEIKGFHFYSAIPGGVGGAICMNAGANGLETSDLVVHVQAMDRRGNLHVFERKAIGFSYRHCAVPGNMIFLSALFKGGKGDREGIRSALERTLIHRETFQPVHSKTAGSTFKNPEGIPAWKAIDDAGCRGLVTGGAEVSGLHCNFMINSGKATSYDLELLAETVRKRVFEHSGIKLEWEVERIGEFVQGYEIQEFLKKND